MLSLVKVFSAAWPCFLGALLLDAVHQDTPLPLPLPMPMLTLPRAGCAVHQITCSPNRNHL